MIVMDSGVGGLSVVRALAQADARARVTYLADTAGFPYGAREADWVERRAASLMQALMQQHASAVIVLACNTLSTLALASLRSQFSATFVGTVPAIKVAAEQSQSRRFTLLATPNTAQGRYVSDLIAQFAHGCVVDCYGAPTLAQLAEAFVTTGTLDVAAVRHAIAPCFFDDAKGRTDAVVLGCTHYPLIADALRHAAPWPVTWIDSSHAIAKRALSMGQADGAPIAYVTRESDVARYAPLFAREGFTQTRYLAVDAAAAPQLHATRRSAE